MTILSSEDIKEHKKRVSVMSKTGLDLFVQNLFLGDIDEGSRNDILTACDRRQLELEDAIGPYVVCAKISGD